MAGSPDVMRESPHDTGSSCGSAPKPLVQLIPSPKGKRHWTPSRFNARTLSPDGRLILWNTLSGSITAFEPDQVPVVERLLSRKGFSAPEKGMTEYLHKRGYIVPEKTNERQRLQFTFGKQQYRTDILSLILMTSEDCNFRCVYCYEDFQRGTMTKETRDGIKALVRKRAPGLKALSISYFGGEPLYGFEAVADLAPFFQEIVKEHGLRYAGHMTTNGYLLTPETADKVLGWDIRDFQITLDGPGEYHDRKRVGRDGSGTFSTIFANLVAMQQRPDKFNITIRVNYDQDNAPALPEFVQMVGEQFGADPRFQMSFHPVGKWGGDNDKNLAVCGLDQEKKIGKAANATAIQHGFEIRGLQAMSRAGNGVCYAARPYNFLIGADGKLMKCTVALDKEDYNIVGKILPDGELELDVDKMALWTEPAFENDTGCAKCYMVPVCQGMHCPLVRITSGKRPCPPQKRTLQAALIDTYESGRKTVQPTRFSTQLGSVPAGV
jgi:uncharacterized protein